MGVSLATETRAADTDREVVESAELEDSPPPRTRVADIFPQWVDDSMKGWLLIETLLVLLVANALAWFVVAMGWPK